ncbi:PoNe immunity protein domain-containing protein [Streptococcus sp. Marseille-P6264]|uniref:PoNe immunity protein domain-containing protein n=1 Tax=Streptococcus sp. Marseille-P6264 TaxID=2487315 RepID=UPI0011E72DCC|nr:PoNe immunity protein domain-containing protein [Streptococcus sp. Marseille-P6264]
MIRDKIQTEEYFQEAFEWYSQCLQEDIDDFEKEKPKDLMSHFRFMVINYEDLLRVGYSLGKDVQELFPYYQGILSNLKEAASEGVPFDLAVDIFALGVLYSERKEEFLDDLKAIYEQMDHTDGLIEYYMVYLFHDKIVPFHSILEYQNMIEDTYESVAKAQGFWYYSHSDAPWYNNHTKDTYVGYWSFDTAATCKIKGIYDERLKDLEYFPYDLLVQGE